jgi:hypothetical protein
MPTPWIIARIVLIICAVLATGGFTILLNAAFLSNCLAGIDVLPTDCWPFFLDYHSSGETTYGDPSPTLGTITVDELPPQREDTLVGFFRSLWPL